jgi:1-phosphatidylinositol-4-phosphate 5-kinase
MNSVYYTDKSLQSFFDLKGSEIGRSAKPDQDVLKDNDLRARLPEEAFSFSPELRQRLRTQVESDCKFLEKMQVMDYSMLIGIHHIPPTKVDQRSNIAETGFKVQEHRSARNLIKKQVASASASASADNDHETDISNSPQYRGANLNASITGGESDSSSRGSMAIVENSKESLPPEGSVAVAGKSDSTRRLIKDIRESAYSASNFEFAGLLEDEDDCSYLEGSENYSQKHARKIHAYQQHPKYDDVEMKKEQTIEQIYWPFHRFYDINGYRRMKPKECYRCSQYPCACDGISDMIKAWGIPEFTPPLSDRKDGGLVMDTTGMSHPMVFHGKQGDLLYDGKIYFMGIIDILQQYNARKRIETTYRKLEVRGRAEPSCVSPQDYADRFIRFFDEYSIRAHPKEIPEEEYTESENRMDNEVQTVVSSDRGVPAVPSGGKDVNASLGPAKVTPADDVKTGELNVAGLRARPSPLKPGQKPTGKYVVT